MARLGAKRRLVTETRTGPIATRGAWPNGFGSARAATLPPSGLAAVAVVLLPSMTLKIRWI